jgi:integrase
MTPHKQKRGKSYRIDKIFAGVGRIAISSGTDHRPTFARIIAMLTGLSKIGRLDVLAGIRDGAHAPLVVLHLYERGQLDKLPSAETAAGLVPALKKFAETHECGASYRSDLGTSIRHIERVPGSKTASVADLPKVVRTLKDRMRDRPVAFNRLRAHMLAFASESQGKHSPLWIDVTRINRFRKAEGLRVKKLLRRPLTVAELDLVCAVYVDHPVYSGKRGGGRTLRRTIHAADLAAMTWTLATTGMRPQEYWEREGASWDDVVGYVRVDGTKTAAAKRVTFRMSVPCSPFCGEQFFRQRFAEATEQALRVGLDAYSLRRTFAKLCEDAGVVASRKDAYMGHGPKTVSDLYLQTNVLPFVAEDAAKVSQWIRAEQARAAASSPALRLTKE